jgi:anionic cell wall polymer biosynthesis LytR-Cps2A-Psr (LCP) family protein
VDGTYRDEPTGLQLSPGPCSVLVFDGEAALALARARHLQRATPDGGWETDPSGDLGRIARQQVMLAAALNQLDADLATIERLSRLLADHAVLDEGLDLSTLVGLGRRLADGPPLVTQTLPVTTEELADGAVVLRLAEGADVAARAYGAPGDATPGGDEASMSMPTPWAITPCP